MREAKKYEEAVKAGKTEHATKVLVSPRRLMTMDQVTENDKERLAELSAEYTKTGLYGDKSVRVSKEGNDFKVLDNEDEVKAMLLAETAYVPVVL